MPFPTPPSEGTEMPSYRISALLLTTALLATAQAQIPVNCTQCAQWNEPQQPFQVYGNTYYVGTHGLSSILITSPQGHVLIDGDMQESAPLIAANIKSLGFRIEDVKLILNSHVHFDHAGGIAGLHELSGAQVAGSPFTARALESGHSGPDDPQFESLPPIQKVANVKVLKDGEVLKAGPLALTAHFTPGHTPGGTTWTWQSCEKERCLNIVYADSLTAVSSANFRFSSSPTAKREELRRRLRPALRHSSDTASGSFRSLGAPGETGQGRCGGFHRHDSLQAPGRHVARGFCETPGAGGGSR
jgi:metallo-beta-lactamase class B